MHEHITLEQHNPTQNFHKFSQKSQNPHNLGLKIMNVCKMRV